MYDYNEACPISMAASVLCERWTLQIIREMFFGSTKYSEIQKVIPNISPSFLRNRLRSLKTSVRKTCSQTSKVRPKTPKAIKTQTECSGAGRDCLFLACTVWLADR